MSISKTNIATKNLNLLVIFNALFETGSVTEASKRLRMSQPNLSRSLRILREEFEDELFVRSTKGITPTKKARELSVLVREAIQSIENVYAPLEFDIKKIKATFTIATTDYIEFLLAPALAEIMSVHAPGITLNFRPSGGYLPKLQMEKGECDLCVFVVRETIPPNFFKQELFSDPYLCAVRKGHPILNKKITMDRFLEYGHVMISPQGLLWAITDSRLEKMGKERRLTLASPNALTSALSIAKTNLILTATKRFVEGTKEFWPIETFKSPFEIDPINIAHVWHERSHEDPLNIWIRQRIKSLL